jgi:hypothetical protein
MRSRLVNPCKPFPSVRIAFVWVLTTLLSGWTCTMSSRIRKRGFLIRRRFESKSSASSPKRSGG